MEAGSYVSSRPRPEKREKGYMTKTNYIRVSTVLLLAMVAAVLVAVIVSYANPASAQSTTAAVPGTTIKVNTIVDESNNDGDCSLREAIQAANTNAAVDGCKAGTGADTIIFSVAGTITVAFSSDLPTITDDLTIDGPGAANLTISQNQFPS